MDPTGFPISCRPETRWSDVACRYPIPPWEGATVRGQRHYAPQELKAIAIERQMREDDQAPPKRKKKSADALGAITTTMISKDRSRRLSKPTRY
jgi:hypothetical protein